MTLRSIETRAKIEFVQRCLLNEDQFFVWVSANSADAGLEIPDRLRTKSSVIFELGPFASSGESTSAYALLARLTFSGEPFAVCLPWSCIFAVQARGEKMTWQRASEPASNVPADSQRARPALRLVRSAP